MRVEQIMSSNVHRCTTRDSLAKAAAIMWDHDCGCVPVVDGSDRVVAVITDRDVAMAALLQDRPRAAISVESARSRQLFACRRETPIVEAERLMRAHEVRRLPVVDDDGKLVGLLSLSDIAREAVRERGRKVKGVYAEEIDLTLAAVSTPRARSVGGNGHGKAHT